MFEDIKDDVKIDANKTDNLSKKDEPVILRQENKKDPSESETAKRQPKALYKGDGRLEFLIDFINLPSVFKKFKDEEFKNKVLLNIKTSIKVAFGSTAEFYKENVASLTIDDEDFYAALDSHIKETKSKDKKNPIGFIWNNA